MIPTGTILLLIGTATLVIGYLIDGLLTFKNQEYSHELITEFIDYCKNDKKITTGFGSCTLSLERYYRKFGFSITQGSEPFVYDGLPEAVIVRFDRWLSYF